MSNVRLLEEIREKNPTLAKSADSGGRKAAIRLFCLECSGGSKAEVRRCPDTQCPLFQYRTGPYIEGGADNTDKRGTRNEDDELETDEMDDSEPPLSHDPTPDDDDEPPL